MLTRPCPKFTRPSQIKSGPSTQPPSPRNILSDAYFSNTKFKLCFCPGFYVTLLPPRTQQETPKVALTTKNPGSNFTIFDPRPSLRLLPDSPSLLNSDHCDCKPQYHNRAFLYMGTTIVKFKTPRLEPHAPLDWVIAFSIMIRSGRFAILIID